MESADTNSEVENDAEMKILRDKFRLSAIAITESQGSILLLLLTNVIFFIRLRFEFLIIMHGNSIMQQNITAWQFQK